VYVKAVRLKAFRVELADQMPQLRRGKALEPFGYTHLPGCRGGMNDPPGYYSPMPLCIPAWQSEMLALRALAVEAKERLLTPKQGEGDDPAPSRPLSDTEQKILELCRQKALKGERIAQKIGLAYDYVRRLLSRLTKEGHLKNTPADGYRTTQAR
jgi:hypothetical protein